MFSPAVSDSVWQGNYCKSKIWYRVNNFILWYGRMTIKIQEFLTKRKIFAQQKYKCCEANSEGEQSGRRTLEQKKKKERERERERKRERAGC